MTELLRRLAYVWLAAVVASAPIALGQVADLPCGTPPAPIHGVIPFTDITLQVGYQPVAAPTTDTLSDYWGGVGGECPAIGCNANAEGTFVNGSFSQAYDLGTVTLPFPFGFSGIYADGGGLNPPFTLSIWANGLLTFDPSVSFNPASFPLQPVPADCVLDQSQVCENTCYSITEDISHAGAVSDTFGGFPFARQWGPPNALIAPWWGDLSVCPNFGQVGYVATLDDAKNPMLVVQWTNVTATKPESPDPNSCTIGDWSSCLNDSFAPYEPGGTLPQFSFQARLHSNSDVDFVYGPASNLNSTGACFEQVVGNCGYVSGIQSNLVFPNDIPPPLLDYATQALDCSATTGCLQPQFPSGTSVTFHDVFRSVGSDVQVVGISPPNQVPQGGSILVPTSMSNGGGGKSMGPESGGGTLQFYFSAGSTSPTGNPFSAQAVPAYAGCRTAPFAALVTIPAQVPQGGGYLIAEFVPGAESVDQTHSFAYAAVVVGPQVADVAAVGPLTFAPASVVGGQSIVVGFQAENIGQLDAPSVGYGIYVSLGGSISPSDLQVGGGVIADLAPGGSPQPISGTATIPATLVSGSYLIAAILNPAGTLHESNVTNNVAIGAKLLGVTSPGPVIRTASLGDARANAPYSVQLLALGGDGYYQWSLSAGSLPGGLTLSKAGLIAGQPQGQVGSAETSQFQVRVTDGLNQSATATLTLTVDPFTQALAIVTQSLPAGSMSQLYDFTIAATGGVAPYRWALVPSGALPTGIQLLATGLLTGEPLYDGSSNFQLTVSDAAGAAVTSPVYTLTVYPAGTLAVGSSILGPCTVGLRCDAKLHYAGGTAPYIWTLLDVQREPRSVSDPGADLGPNLPPNLQFFPVGQIEGIPKEAGVFLLTVEVTDSETPLASATGLVLLTISSSTSFAFTTVQLPDATINQYYSTQLVTTDPTPNDVSCQVLNTSEIASDVARLTVPPGLTLYSTCQLAGVPLELGSFSFLVQAVDGQGDVAIQSFTVTVDNGASGKGSSGGCQSGSGTTAFAGLLLALALGRRRGCPRQ